MAISNELLTTTLQSVRDEFIDQLYKNTPILDWLNRTKHGKQVESWGIFIQEPFAVAEHAGLTAFPTGAESLNIAVADVTQPAKYYPADMGAPIVIFRKEEEENKGNDKAIIKILSVRTKSVLGVARRAISRQILAGDDVTGLAASLLSLYGHQTGVTTGFLEGAATGSQTNTVGGLSKTLARGLRNQFQDVGDDFSANGPAAMTDLWTSIKDVGLEGPPDGIVASTQAFRNYKATLFANERFSSKDDLDAGRMNLKFDSAEIFSDSDMPTSSTNDQEASMYFLNSEAFYLAFWSGCEFDVGEFMPIRGQQLGRQADLYVKLQLALKNGASLGFLADGNTN